MLTGGGMFGQDDQQDPTKNDSPADDSAVVEPTADEPKNTPVTVTDSGSTDDAGSKTPDEPDTPETPSAPTSSDSSNDSNLLQVKKDALTELAPLVDKLDQTPEEHFKTVMMLIQATDNSEHVKDAYEAAKNIGDDAVRAQALLDIVNEINYFTQGKK